MYYLRGMAPRGPLLRLLLAALLPAVLLAAACGGEASSSGSVPPEGLERALAEGRLLLDVRSPEEYRSGHVPGATLIPVQELAARMDEIDAWRERGVVAYCERGGRAARAAEMLREAGFEDVALLEGSMARWRAEGRPVETPGADDAR